MATGRLSSTGDSLLPQRDSKESCVQGTGLLCEDVPVFHFGEAEERLPRGTKRCLMTSGEQKQWNEINVNLL